MSRQLGSRPMNIKKKLQAASVKPQASSLTAAGACDSYRIIKENKK